MASSLGDIPIPTLPESGGDDPSSPQESVEESVASLMGEIGKHIEGQLRAEAAVEGAQGEAGSSDAPVTTDPTQNSEQDSGEGEATRPGVALVGGYSVNDAVSCDKHKNSSPSHTP